MRRCRHGVSGLALFGACALLAVSCGGDDQSGSGAPSGGGAGKGAGSAGRGSAGASSGGRGGTGSGGGANAGEAGATGVGGEAGDGSNAGDGGQAGGEGGGQAGAGGEGTDTRLTVRDEISKLIVAEDGGTVTLGRLSLEIPPDALDEDTEITIKSFEESDTIFVLEPDGLSFESPILAHFTVPPPESEDEDEDDGALLVLAETASLGEWSELVSGVRVERVQEDEYRATLELEHFSFIEWFELGRVPATNFYIHEHLTPESIGDVPVGAEIGVVHAYSAAVEPDFSLRVGVGVDTSTRLIVHLDAVSLLSTQVHSAGAVKALPVGEEAVEDAPVLLENAPVTATRLFSCLDRGEGTATVQGMFRIEADIVTTRAEISYDTSVRYRYRRETVESDEQNVTFEPLLFVADRHAANCVEGPSVIDAVANDAIARALRTRFKTAWKDYCFWLSDGSSCQSPNPELAIVNVLDPVLQIGTNAAARIESAFPCGEGPLGTTVCGSAGAFAPGEYVFLLATFGGDIPTADPTGMFQHAFVFDADGIASNNYVPSSQYPKDFFQGTDKWYQIFYTPADGFSLRVIDARVSVSNPIASGARLIVAGREFAALIPRAELDGAAPGFRVSSFRHEGDYGLSGGPWNASYHPPLDEPLLPAAAGETLVLPED